MTEEQWLQCTEPWMLYRSVRPESSMRRRYLLSAACCRQVWHRLYKDSLPQVVATTELYADGLVPRKVLRDANQTARWVEQKRFKRLDVSGISPGFSAASALVSATTDRISHRRTLTVMNECQEEADDEARKQGLPRGVGGETAQKVQCELIRDILGPPPFHLAPLDPAWLTPTVTAVARAAYEERHLPSGLLDAACLAVLADALEDAGCDRAELLGHLRGPGPHVRGCWALDAILGKS
jgi:hypothetical protein